MDLHSKLSSLSVSSQGLSLLPKLKREHIELTSFSKMRVDLAAQVCHKLYKHTLHYCHTFVGIEQECV